jgi:hypothetical protein
MTVWLRVQVRRFYCRNPACQHRIFTERFAEELKPYARRTVRLQATLWHIGYVLGGVSIITTIEPLHCHHNGATRLAV